MRDALSYLVQALTLNYQNSSFTKGGLLAWTDPKPDALQNTMSDTLRSYKSAVCECLTKHAKPNTTCAAAAVNVSVIAACHPEKMPLVSMGDLLHNSSAGYRCRPSLMPPSPPHPPVLLLSGPPLTPSPVVVAGLRNRLPSTLVSISGAACPTLVHLALCQSEATLWILRLQSWRQPSSKSLTAPAALTKRSPPTCGGAIGTAQICTWRRLT